MMAVLTVLDAGHAFVQDLGRYGVNHVGLPSNGASDGYAASVANLLVGNRAEAPLVEVTASGLRVRAEQNALVAVTGAAPRVIVDNVRQQSWQLLALYRGARLIIDPPESGMRTYLAVNGTIDAARYLGSVAPDPFVGVGTRLQQGDVLQVKSRYEELDHPHLRHPVFRLGAKATTCPRDVAIDVTPGPEADQFRREVLTQSAPWTVSSQSDHVGLRLRGETPQRHVRGEIISRGVPVGAIEVPPSGGLLVLLRGRLVTAGYPVLGVATSVSVDRLGQARPGDTIRFRPCSLEDAVRTLQARRRDLDDLQGRVKRALGSLGLGHVLDPSAIER